MSRQSQHHESHGMRRISRSGFHVQDDMMRSKFNSDDYSHDDTRNVALSSASSDSRSICIRHKMPVQMTGCTGRETLAVSDVFTLICIVYQHNQFKVLTTIGKLLRTTLSFEGLERLVCSARHDMPIDCSRIPKQLFVVRNARRVEQLPIDARCCDQPI
jgi:hypothetical protein